MSSLRQYLALCPYEYGYDTSHVKAMRAGLRRRLFTEATANNKYINYLFADDIDVLNPKPAEWLGEPRRSHDGRPCVRRLRQGEAAYRCGTCGLDDTCVLCQYCYRPEDHVGHDIFMRITHRDDGGICDCGDDEAWKVPLTCAAQNLEAEAGSIPQELVESLESTVATALDFVLDVMSASHSGVQFMDRPLDIIKNVNESQFDPALYGREVPGDSRYVLSLWNDERRSFLDATLAIQLATEKSAEFGIMVARRIDAYGRGIIKVSSNLDHLLELKRRINLFTVTIRSVRDYMREEMADEIIHWLLDLTWARPREGSASTLRNIVGKALCDPWRCGNAHLNANNSMSMDMTLPNPLWHNSSLNGRKIPRLDDRAKDCDFVSTPPAPSQTDAADMFDFDNTGMTFSALARSNLWVQDPGTAESVEASEEDSNLSPTDRRFKYLIFFDPRFWKSGRQTLQDLYVSALISDHEYKMIFGLEYAEMYPQIAELYVLLDREPEVSCIQSLSTQLFTTPSIATELLQGPYFSQYIASLFTLLTLQKIGPLSCITDKMKLDADSPILRNRRFGQLFHEMAFLLSRNSNKKSIAANPRTLLQVADFLSLCQGLSPVKRQTDKHIEFESEGWVFVFTTIPFVLQLGQGVAVGAFDCTFEESKQPISCVAQILLRWAFQYMSKAQNKVIGSVNCASSYSNQSVQCTVSDYDPGEGIVSFHHPVHAFLSFLLQNCHLPDVQSLKEILFDGNEELRQLGFDEQFVRSILFEHPIQCIAVLSQVRVGLWVRNGYTMRSQLHHYRENTLRELAYAQDLFMAQVALVTLDTNTAFIQLVRRWNLDDWTESKFFDENQRFYILEEFLHTLNILLADRIYLQDESQDTINSQYYKREVIQALTFMDMSYSDICRYVPEPMTADDEFELVLKACAKFSPPKGVNDVGVYSLLPELLTEFNPHYTHFSSARIEEAENAISKRLSEIHKCAPENIVHLAPLPQLYGPWADLGAFTRSVSFANFISHLFKTLISSVGQKNQADIETVLNSALYLLLMAAKDDLIRDKSKSVADDGVFDSLREWIVAENDGFTFLQLLQEILRTPQLASIHVRVRKLCDLLDATSAQDVTEYTVPEGRPDDKKELGKQAKLKIMEEMRRQQMEFQQHQVEDEMDDEEELVEEDGNGWSFAKSNCVLCHMPDNENSIFGQMTFTCNVSVVRDFDEEWSEEGYSGNSSSLDVAEPERVREVKGNEWWKKYIDESDDTSVGKAYPSEKVHKDISLISGCGHGVHYSCYREYIAFQRTRSDQLMRLPAEDSRRGEYLCPLCRALNNGFVPIIWNNNTATATDILNEITPREVDFVENFQQNSKTVQNDSLRLVVDQFIVPKFKDQMKEQNSSFKEALSEQVARIGEIAGIAAEEMSVDKIYPIFADTIRCIEIALRGKANSSPFGGIVLDQLSGKNVKNLRIMAHYLEAVTTFSINSNLIDSTPSDPVNFDPLQHFITCLYWACPVYNLSVAMALRWSYIMCICQYLYALRANPNWKLPNYGELKNKATANSLLSMVKGNPEEMYSMMARNVTIFLRRCSLVIHGLAGVYDEDDFKFMQDKPEHERLCLFLNLPTLDEMLIQLADNQTDDFRISGGLGNLSQITMRNIEYPGIYKLIKLPPRLDCFFNVRDSTEDFPVDPAICLFCGQVIPFQLALIESNDKGQCNKHVAECYKHYGLYILPRRNHLFLITKNKRGTFTEAPYLDLHGEPDETMRRGHAHFLHPIRCDNITRRLWLENEIFDTIARKVDQNVDYGGWDTI